MPAPFRAVLLDAVTADETTSAPWDCSDYPQLTVYTIGSGTITGGVVTIEEASYDPTAFGSDIYTGTWSSITTVTATDVDANKQKASHLDVGAPQWVRARISTAIAGGGTVTVVLHGASER